jgi:hypothetical protein
VRLAQRLVHTRLYREEPAPATSISPPIRASVSLSEQDPPGSRRVASEDPGCDPAASTIKQDSSSGSARRLLWQITEAKTAEPHGFVPANCCCRASTQTIDRIVAIQRLLAPDWRAPGLLAGEGVPLRPRLRRRRQPMPARGSSRPDRWPRLERAGAQCAGVPRHRAPQLRRS